MELYELITDHIIVTETSSQDPVILSDNVIGFSIEVLSDSASALLYGLNEAPKISMVVGNAARAYGGFVIEGKPGLYRGQIQTRFVNAGGRALLIITRLKIAEPICTI